MRETTSTGPSTGPVILPYAARPRFVIRGRHILFALAGFVVAAVAVGWATRGAWYPRARDRLALLFAQRRCMRYAPPAEQVVFTTYEADVLSIEDDIRYWFRLSVSRHAGMAPAAVFRAGCLADLSKWAPVRPPELYASPSGTVFLHGRSTAAGRTRLVLVECANGNDVMIDHHGVEPYPVEGFVLRAATLVPAGLSGLPAWDYHQGGEYWGSITAPHDFGTVLDSPPYPAHTQSMLKEPPPERIFAGQADPNDSAKFTIRCQYNGTDWYIDGHLVDTPGGDVTVTLTMRGFPGEAP